MHFGEDRRHTTAESADISAHKLGKIPQNRLRKTLFHDFFVKKRFVA